MITDDHVPSVCIIQNMGALLGTRGIYIRTYYRTSEPIGNRLRNGDYLHHLHSGSENKGTRGPLLWMNDPRTHV